MSIDINAYQGDVTELLHLLFNIYGWGWGGDILRNFLLGLADYPERKETKDCALKNVEKYYTEEEDKLRAEKIREVENKINKNFDRIKSCDLEIEIDDKKQNKGFIQFTVNKYHRIKVGFLELFSERFYYPMVEYAYPSIDGVTGHFVHNQGVNVIEAGCNVMKHDRETGQIKNYFHVKQELNDKEEPQKLEKLKEKLRNIQYVYSEKDPTSGKDIYKIKKIKETEETEETE